MLVPILYKNKFYHVQIRFPKGIGGAGELGFGISNIIPQNDNEIYNAEFSDNPPTSATNSIGVLVS